MEKPEEERSLLLKCLPPVGNISKQSGTKTPRNCSLQNVPKGDFFQSRLAASELLPHLEQQSRCQNIEWLKLALPPTWLKSCTVYAVSQWSPSLTQLLSVPAEYTEDTEYTSAYIGQYSQTTLSVLAETHMEHLPWHTKFLSAPLGYCCYLGQIKTLAILHWGPGTGRRVCRGENANSHLPPAAPYKCSPTLSWPADPNQRTWLPWASCSTHVPLANPQDRQLSSLCPSSKTNPNTNPNPNPCLFLRQRHSGKTPVTSFTEEKTSAV